MSVKIRQTNPDWLPKLLKRYGKGGDVAVGWPRGKKGTSLTYPTGESVLQVMIWNTFGTSTIPRRDALTPGGKDAVAKANKQLPGMIRQINAGKFTVTKALDVVGQLAVGEVQASMTNLKEPPNAPATIQAKKGANNPLINTGLARQSVSYDVREK